MQINNVSNSELIKCLKELKKTKSVDVFYFADSFGNMNPKDVKKICKTVTKHWNKEVGIHTHDNCGMALKNSIQAYKSGVTWIDGTIQGMGRGAGNVTTENLLKYFSKLKMNYKASSISNVSKSLFKNLKKKYNWGKSEYYKSAAKYNIHPTYIQELQTDNRYNKKEILNAINSLKKINAKSYDPKKFEAIFIEEKKYKGKWNASSWCREKPILILGQGPSLKMKKNLDKIKDYILRTKCLVLCININNSIPKNLIDFHISSNETRIMVDQQKYIGLKKPIILPIIRLKKINKNYGKIKIFDYGIKLKANSFDCNSNFAILPYNQSFGYAVSVAIVGQARGIAVAGFDGYAKDHMMQIEMLTTISLIFKKYPKLNLKSITPTSYPIKQIKYNNAQR